MSTSSKILENHLEISKISIMSPRSSLGLQTSPHLTIRSRKQENSDDDTVIDQEQVQLLQLKQLKRQNNFLKKKIQELLKQRNGQSQFKKKKNNKGAHKQSIDSIHLSVEYFFQQISNLINSVVELFRLDFSEEEVQAFQKRYTVDENPTKKYLSFKKSTLNKKLQKILLQEEEKRYQLLLGVFSDYYKVREQNQTHIRKVVDEMTTKAIDLNKLIIEKAQQRVNLKNSLVRSLSYEEENCQSFQSLKLPLCINIINSPRSAIKENFHKKT